MGLASRNEQNQLAGQIMTSSFPSQDTHQPRTFRTEQCGIRHLLVPRFLLDGLLKGAAKDPFRNGGVQPVFQLAVVELFLDYIPVQGNTHS